MLKILLSPDHITLCDTILDRIGERIKDKEQGQLLIVPEQYSFEMERRLASLGDDTCRYAEVLGLSRLAGRVESVYGGAAELRLDQGGRLLTADLAVDQAFPRLKFFASVCRKPEFLESFLSAVDEWESYNLLPQDLLDASARFTGSFAQKLEELGLLYEGYRTACGVAQDPVLRLRRLCDLLESETFLADKDLYFYGFSDFTALELEILEASVSGARSVTLALPYEGEEHESVFPQTSRLLTDLMDFCKSNEIEVSQTALPVFRQRPAGLAALQDHLSEFSKPAAVPADDSVKFRAYPNPEEECRAAAVQIRALLRSGVRCREIGVACADGSYRSLLRDVLRDAEIPSFFSGRTTLTANAGAKIILLALRAILGGLQEIDVLSYLKSGVADDAGCDELENYAVLWNIRGNAWFTPWKKNPSGVKSEFRPSETELLQRLNRTRAELLQPLSKLRARMLQSSCVAEMVRSVYAFMQDVSLSDILLAAAEALRAEGDEDSAKQYEQVYDLLLDALEQLCLVDGEQLKDPESFCSLLEKLLDRYSVSSIPGTLDQVLVADVPSFRSRAIRHLFILGASEGNFPSCGPDHGILTETERKQLIQAGIDMAPMRDYVFIREMNGVYQTIRSAEESVVISCTRDSASALMLRLADPFGKPQEAPERPAPLNPQEAAALHLRTGCGGLPPESAACLHSYQKRISDDPGKVSEEHLQKLYRDVVSLSPTSSDVFASCRFSYFLHYGLRANPREPAEFDARQFGSFVHGALETMVNGVVRQGGFHALNSDAWRPIAEAAVERYVQTNFTDLQKRDGSTQYFIERAKSEAIRAAQDLYIELRQSEFEPCFCELKFGKDGMLPPIRIEGKRSACVLNGSVDRVDILKREDGSYVRVVDYKTGNKKFDYTYYSLGKEMQLILYLSALKKTDNPAIGENLRSAGVLYQPVGIRMQDYSDAPTPEDAQEQQLSAHKRRGVVLNDPSLLAAMEQNLDQPKILPLKRDKKNNLVADNGDLLTPDRMQELEDFVSRKLGEIADGIKSGVITPDPVDYGSTYKSCNYCKYLSVCQKDRLRCAERKIKKVSSDDFFERIEKEGKGDG